jgi:hypothetical protein
VLIGENGRQATGGRVLPPGLSDQALALPMDGVGLPHSEDLLLAHGVAQVAERKGKAPSSTPGTKK